MRGDKMENLENSLHLADSLDLLKKWYREGRREFIDLNYNDPPFNSNRDYNILWSSETNISEELEEKQNLMEDLEMLIKFKF
jgi:DNA modification methylase